MLLYTLLAGLGREGGAKGGDHTRKQHLIPHHVRLRRHVGGGRRGLGVPALHLLERPLGGLADLVPDVGLRAGQPRRAPERRQEGPEAAGGGDHCLLWFQNGWGVGFGGEVPDARTRVARAVGDACGWCWIFFCGAVRRVGKFGVVWGELIGWGGSGARGLSHVGSCSSSIHSRQPASIKRRSIPSSSCTVYEISNGRRWVSCGILAAVSTLGLHARICV